MEIEGFRRRRNLRRNYDLVQLPEDATVEEVYEFINTYQETRDENTPKCTTIFSIIFFLVFGTLCFSTAGLIHAGMLDNEYNEYNENIMPLVICGASSFLPGVYLLARNYLNNEDVPRNL